MDARTLVLRLSLNRETDLVKMQTRLIANVELLNALDQPKSGVST